MTNLSQGGAAFIAKEDIEKELETAYNMQEEKIIILKYLLLLKNNCVLPVP